MKSITALLLLVSTAVYAQENSSLTVEKIMRDSKWMGVSPSNIHWADNSKSVYFNWNPQQKKKDELYFAPVSGSKPVKAADSSTEKAIGPQYIFNADKTLGIAAKDGDIYLLQVKSGKVHRLTNTLEAEHNPTFLLNDQIAFQREDNVFSLNLKTNELKQLSNFMKGKSPSLASPKPVSAQDAWLKKEQLALFDVLKDKKPESEHTSKAGTERPKAIYLDNQMVEGLRISPDGRFISYQLISPATGNKKTIVPNYVTSSGYTEDIQGRTKVGESRSVSHDFIYDYNRDTVYAIHVEQIPGIKDLPDYLSDYPAQLAERKKKNEDRQVRLTPVVWNPQGSAAVLTGESMDNKDRWVLSLDAASGNLKLVDRQRDEAWIEGPGIPGYYSNIGWIDNNRIYYQSEATGYSHLYLSNIHSGEKKQLTRGNWEVQTLELSKDKKTFYFTANKVHPGITQFYRISVNGGEPVQLTNMKGGNEVTLSPDEKWLAIRHSYMNKPWELYIQANTPGAKVIQITQSTTAEFKAYNWREPDLLSFKNRYGADVYARVYPAKNPGSNHPAVVFVHGAGYLQNVHYWWSEYFREYMFNNLLANSGYTVIDIDYTGSSGYGRAHRTGIYRHMGGKDLSDQVDGVKLLVEKYGVNPKHVGIYGGSYGGFITLMALFKEPEVFASGAALRSVTDWAHYNHGYTSNILNEPFNDELAYQRSSPINFASGLKGNLLMCHGMVDVNVHFQDIVRLSQRLIELGKNNWELAVYPVESHGFTEPSSWTDEYKRIFRLFETTLKKP